MVCGGVGSWAAAMLVVAMKAMAALSTILTIIVDLPDWICDGKLYRLRLAASSPRSGSSAHLRTSRGTMGQNEWRLDRNKQRT
jgi:hypothetical protein